MNKNKKMTKILPLPKSGFTNESPFHTVQRDIHIPPPSRSVVLDESPPPIVGPNTQELQDIKNMILTLQLDLLEERTKRECLEEIVRKFKGNPTRKSHKMQERKWCLSDMQGLNEEIPQDQSFLPAPNTTKDLHEKIAELRSDFDLRLSSLDQSLLEIRSILTNNSVSGPKGDNRISLGPRPSEDKDCNRFLYKKLERGIFPQQITLKNAITKSVGELLHKPWAEKTEIEAIMDQYYLENLPPALLQQGDIQNEDLTTMTRVQFKPSSNLDSRRTIL